MLKNHRPLRVAVLCSHRAPGLLYLLNRSPARGVAYEIVCAITSEPTFAEELSVERRGIPTRSHAIEAHRGGSGRSMLDDPQGRVDYDAETLSLVEPFLPDLILLDGYRYLVTAPILRAFRNRVMNLHFSDLAIRTSTGAPRYAGIRAVRDALAAGSRETRASVHLANDEPDAGAVIVRSWAFPVSPLVADLTTAVTSDALKAYVFAHEQWMMQTASGPLIAAALQLVANGTVDLDRLAADPAPGTPWVLEQQGVLTAPELEFA